jgi:hypothetical protein
MIQYREITNNDRNYECPILLEMIESNQMYYRCEQCQYNFKKEAILQLQCPMCRFIWVNDSIYINCNEQRQCFYDLLKILIFDMICILMFVPFMLLYFHCSKNNK